MKYLKILLLVICSILSFAGGFLMGLFIDAYIGIFVTLHIVSIIALILIVLYLFYDLIRFIKQKIGRGDVLDYIGKIVFIFFVLGILAGFSPAGEIMRKILF